MSGPLTLFRSLRGGIVHPRRVETLASPDAARNGDRERRLLLGSATGIASRGIALGASLVTVPLLLRHLGPVDYGVWAAIMAGAAWLTLTQFGIAPSLLNRLSGRRGAASARIGATAWWLGWALAAASITALVPLYVLIPWGAAFNLSSPETASQARDAVAAVWVGIALGIPASVPIAILRSRQQVYLANLIEIGTSMARLIALILLVAAGASMALLALGVTAAGILATILGVLGLGGRTIEAARLRAFDMSEARAFLRAGMGFTGISLAALLIMYTDVIVITQALGPAAVTRYAVSFSLLSLFLGLELAVLDASWPAFTEAASNGDFLWLRSTFRRLLWGLTAAAAGFAIVIIATGAELIDLWAGPAAAPPGGLLGVLALIAIVQAYELPHGRLMVAVGRIRLYTAIGLVNAGVNLVLSIVFVRSLGVTGVAIATLIGYLLTAPVLVFFARRILAQSQGSK
jgi:O-antigen/teichoic acid export membrane protein